MSEYAIDPVRLARLRILRAADSLLDGRIETAAAARDIDRSRLVLDPMQEDRDLVWFGRIAADPSILNSTMEAAASKHATDLIRTYGRPA
jgi:hypothetical protein